MTAKVSMSVVGEFDHSLALSQLEGLGLSEVDNSAKYLLYFTVDMPVGAVEDTLTRLYQVAEAQQAYVSVSMAGNFR